MCHSTMSLTRCYKTAVFVHSFLSSRRFCAHSMSAVRPTA